MSEPTEAELDAMSRDIMECAKIDGGLPWESASRLIALARAWLARRNRDQVLYKQMREWEDCWLWSTMRNWPEILRVQQAIKEWADKLGPEPPAPASEPAATAIFSHPVAKSEACDFYNKIRLIMEPEDKVHGKVWFGTKNRSCQLVWESATGFMNYVNGLLDREEKAAAAPTLNDKARLAREWAQSPAGREDITKVLADSKVAQEAVVTAREVDPATLNIPYTAPVTPTQHCENYWYEAALRAEKQVEAQARRIAELEADKAKLRSALGPFAAMDRPGGLLNVIACSRGTGMSKTILTEPQFRDAARVLEETRDAR